MPGRVAARPRRGRPRIINALRESGELDNTLVIFTSDNGFFGGEHRIPTGKNRVYEEAVRVPLMMRGPGIPPAMTVKEMSANTDLAPTIADAAGAKPLVKVDGRSLMPLAAAPRPLQGPRDPARAVLGPRRGGRAEHRRLHRRSAPQRYKYVDNATGEIELYDLEEDPYELDNLYGKSEYAELEGYLHEDLAGLADCAGATCRTQPSLQLQTDGKRRKESKRGKHKRSKRTRRCVRRLHITVAGTTDEPLTSAQFKVNGKRAGSVDEPPFRATVRHKKLGDGRHAEISVDAELLDGRIRTVRDRYKLCR